MKKNMYWSMSYGRGNHLKTFFLSFFYKFSSYPRLLIEAFIRKDFGERYFRLSAACVVAVELVLLPIIIRLSNHLGFGWSFIGHYLTWYLFIAGFLYKSIQHYKAMKHAPGVFDFARFSKSKGTVHPFFFTIQLPDRKTDIRRVSCLIEPGAIFLAGLFLYLLGQRVGNLLLVCSLFYSFSYFAAYMMGDGMVMDIIDEMIINQEMKKSFVDDLGPAETRGFEFMGRRPASTEKREQILASMMPQEEVFEAQ